MSEFRILRNCVLPLGLYYKIEEHIWLRLESDGLATLGFTDVAQTTAGGMLHVTFRALGKSYPAGKSVAVVESAKWLGSLRTPVTGTLAAVNETLLQDAGLINRSPYRRGWVVKMQPDDIAADLQRLRTGDAALAAYDAFMAAKRLDDCIHCEGYELPDGH
ncbi:MAG: hypothetical protein K1X65_04155 [Caldilineales bacterium]|nr:hypothetical protein [Caldilineales bacterium]MCW5856798.1 hypothetical protein [Caldilineales bacterium]